MIITCEREYFFFLPLGKIEDEKKYLMFAWVSLGYREAAVNHSETRAWVGEIDSSQIAQK